MNQQKGGFVRTQRTPPRSAPETDVTGAMEQLQSMLVYWMSNAYDPLLSWKVLTDALKAPTVGESRLARELEERYCSPEDQNSLGESDAI